jgi:hypothetical protein
MTFAEQLDQITAIKSREGQFPASFQSKEMTTNHPGCHPERNTGVNNVQHISTVGSMWSILWGLLSLQVLVLG